MAVSQNRGVHPKKAILKYENWFLSQIEAHEIVLDIGCNTGSLTMYLGNKAKKAYGIEIHEKHVEKARKLNNNSKVEFFCADATKFNYKDIPPINAVILSNVLEHIEDRVTFLKMILASVNWGASPKVLIRIPTIERDWLAQYKKEIGIEYRLDKTHYIEHSEEEFRKELNESGLVIDKLFVKYGEIFAHCSLKTDSSKA